VSFTRRIKGRHFLLLSQRRTINPPVPALYLTVSRAIFLPVFLSCFLSVFLSFFLSPACLPILLLPFEVLSNNGTVHSTAGQSHRSRPCRKRLQAFFRPARVVVETCDAGSFQGTCVFFVSLLTINVAFANAASYHALYGHSVLLTVISWQQRQQCDIICLKNTSSSGSPPSSSCP